VNLIALTPPYPPTRSRGGFGHQDPVALDAPKDRALEGFGDMFPGKINPLLVAVRNAGLELQAGFVAAHPGPLLQLRSILQP
jgi:hypothetical protein